jgi:hypothetical protein
VRHYPRNDCTITPERVRLFGRNGRAFWPGGRTYRDENAPVSLAGDWHDRYRPGVIRRINALAGRCSLENHQPRDDQPLPGGPVVPVTGAAEQIATWWATSRTDPPPEPDEWHLATATARRRPGARR